MIVEQALKWTANILRLHGVEDSRLEARILLGHVLMLSPARIYARPEQALSQEQVTELQQLVERRSLREPTAYIMKRREFYGIDFYVDPRVLVPRPETELIVEEAIKFASAYSNYPSSSKDHLTIADIGTGCGAIAISLALNLPFSKIYATDISPAALEVAHINCERRHIANQITFLRGNLLEPLPEIADLIVANLPYIRNSELAYLSPEVSDFEPRVALDGGQSGLDKIQELLEQCSENVESRSCILLEIGYKQDDAAVSLINKHLPEARVELIPDFNGINRVVSIKL